MTASQHLRALFAHVGDGLVDYAHPQRQHRGAPAGGLAARAGEVDVRRLEELPVVVVEEDVVDSPTPIATTPPSWRRR